MDADGYVTWIFRAALADGRYDTIAVKDTIYNRFVETPQGKQQTESQDLRTLVNRAALTFYAQDASTVSLLPSTIGQTALVIQQGKSDGRLLPPIFIRGNNCDRPEGDENGDSTAAKQVTGQAQGGATPGGAPGAAGK
jgi:hypothetical protein